MIEPKVIVVTGCAGFIGSNFVKQFTNKFPKTEIIGIDDLSTGDREAVDASMTFYENSILDRDFLNQVFDKHRPEYVFHFAALPRISFSLKYPVRSSNVNIIGTVSLLEASKKHKIKRFIYSSSSSVYGHVTNLPTKESVNMPNPASPYAVQKHVGEQFSKVYSELFELDTVCLRYFTVFGPGQHGDSPYSTVVAAWLESMFFPDKKQGFIEGDGEQTRDFCFIDNVVQANILAMESQKNFKGEVFNIAHGEQISLNKVKELIEKITEKNLELEKRSPRLGDVRHTLADISKAKSELGYMPKVRFEEGLVRTVDWFKSLDR
jgi:UDP-glucose 4-epimerase